MNPVQAALIVALAMTGAPGKSPADAHAKFIAATPVAAVQRLADVYNARSVPGLDGLLTADYRFHFSGGDAAGSRYAQGLTREQEMTSTTAMFSFAPADSSIRRPQIDSLQVTVGVIEEGVDPEHPDSTCQYRLAIAHDFRIRMVYSTGQSWTPKGSLQVFHIVRGDAAVRVPGQPADTTRWYIRRWLEDLDAITIALGNIDGVCGGSSAENAPLTTAPSLMALRAINAPVCPTLKVLCDLPGSEPALLEVYDIQGRRLAQRTVTPQSPGSVLVEAGSGKRFVPGAYWVRLAQGKRPPVTRMVMVAR